MRRYLRPDCFCFCYYSTKYTQFAGFASFFLASSGSFHAVPTSEIEMLVQTFCGVLCILLLWRTKRKSEEAVRDDDYSSSTPLINTPPLFVVPPVYQNLFLGTSFSFRQKGCVDAVCN